MFRIAVQHFPRVAVEMLPALARTRGAVSTRTFSNIPLDDKSQEKTEQTAYRILSIDGGGIRGIIPGMIIKYMEDYTGKPLHKFFDCMAGTSTGAILCLGASAPQTQHSNTNRFSAEEGVLTYAKPGMSEEIFFPVQIKPKDPYKPPGFDLLTINYGSGQLKYDSDALRVWYNLVRTLGLEKYLWTQYSEKNLEKILKEKFDSLRLADALTDLVITSVDVDAKQPRLFTREKAKHDDSENHLFWEVARMTSAAPTFFNPFVLDDRPLIDGGMVANNPALCAITDAVARGYQPKDIMCISIGTGEYSSPLDTTGYGRVHIAPYLYDIMSQAASNLVDQQCQQLLGNNFHRFQATLEEDIPLDGKGPEVIESIIGIGLRLLGRKKKSIEQVCDRLVEISNNNGN